MNLMATAESLNRWLHGLVWGPVMLVFLVGMGVFFTLFTGFFQLRRFGEIMRSTVGSLFGGGRGSRKKEGKNITPFQALTAALASTVGVGNVAGVATAIVAGGPGALFWMWVSAFFGMMTKYAEVALAVHFRQTDKQGRHYGGPMYYMEQGLGSRGLAICFSVFGALACFGIGNMNQANELAAAAHNTFGVSHAAAGVAAAALVGLVILGGVGRIARVTELVVPVMALLFVGGSIWALILSGPRLPAALLEVYRGAFGLRPAGGGVMGYTMMQALRYGGARGVFSNEAGLGSAPLIHAAADTDSPVRQGMWGIFEVFVDTVVMCSITGLVIVASGLAGQPVGPMGQPLNGGALTAAAYETMLGGWGGSFVSVAVLFFAMATLLGWSYYGERCVGYLTGNSPAALLAYRCVYIFFIVVGATGRLTLVWEVSDTLNGMMAIPNLLALAGLSGVVLRLTRDHRRRSGNPKPPQNRSRPRCR